MNNAPTFPASLEEIVAAAKEFERIINSSKVNLKISITALNYSTTTSSQTFHRVEIRTDDQVYP